MFDSKRTPTSFKEGDPANTFYLIREGNVAVEVFAPQRKPIIVATLSVGELLGWSWLLPPFQWKFHARAIHDVRAIALDGNVYARSARRTMTSAMRC